MSRPDQQGIARSIAGAGRIQRNGGGGSEVFRVKDDNRVASRPCAPVSMQDGQWS